MSSKIKRTGPGTKGIKKRFKKGKTVDVGIIDAGKKTGVDATVAEIGFYNEFGTSKIPERSFIRSTLLDKKKEIKGFTKKLFSKVLKGEITTEKGLGLIGIFVADEIKKKIVAIKTPENKPETIMRKGSSNPLIDTGQLKNSIIHKVNK